MAPNAPSTPAGVPYMADKFDGKLKNLQNTKKTDPQKPYKIELVWRNIIILGSLHIGALYGTYLLFTTTKIQTIVFAVTWGAAGGFGITAGVHRLWAHRSYKAKWPLRLLLTFFNTIAFQDPIIHWARDHRLHHKYSETNADPYNAKRGFFFAHVGWLLCRKHPEVKEKGKGIDMSDLNSDPILRFQKKYYLILMLLCCAILPTIIPVFAWNESWIDSWFVSAVFRYVVSVNTTWLVNSAAHLYGNKPYDRNIYPSENLLVSLLTSGEGWHNYHHTFPWDYKTSELGNYSLNTTNAFIDFFAWIGWAYDLKTVSPDIIKKRVHRTGDGSHDVWGWDDKNITKEDQEATIITHEKS